MAHVGSQLYLPQRGGLYEGLIGVCVCVGHMFQPG